MATEEHELRHVPAADMERHLGVVPEHQQPHEEGAVFLPIDYESARGSVTDLIPRRHEWAGLVEIGRSTVRAAMDSLAVTTNQAVHGFGSQEFWNQMREPLKVRTSFGTEHMVRIIGKERLGDPKVTNVAILNPLGTSSAGGYIAELAHEFYEAGCAVWNVSSPGFEGKLPLREVSKLTIQHETKYVAEALELAAAELGLELPENTFGGSQGGGLAVGLRYRDAKQGRRGVKTVAVTPSSGHNSHKVTRALRYAKQFVIDEPRALRRHIMSHPNGPLRRSLQLAPTVNLKPRALMQVIGAGYGIVFRPGHETFLAQANSEEMAPYFDPEEFVVFCFSNDVVARSQKWPGSKEVPGLHMDVLDPYFTLFAIEFFKRSRGEGVVGGEEVVSYRV